MRVILWVLGGGGPILGPPLAPQTAQGACGDDRRTFGQDAAEQGHPNRHLSERIAGPARRGPLPTIRLVSSARLPGKGSRLRLRRRKPPNYKACLALEVPRLCRLFTNHRRNSWVTTS